MKYWVIWKDPDAGKDWRWEEKGPTQDEMVGWHRWLDAQEFEQALGVGHGQESLACCSPWGCKELDTTEQLNWTDVGDEWNLARVQFVREWGQWLSPVDVKCMMTVMPFRDSLFPLSSSSLKLIFIKSVSEAHTWGCWCTSSKGEALTPWLCHVVGCGPSSYLPIPSTRFS